MRVMFVCVCARMLACMSIEQLLTSIFDKHIQMDLIHLTSISDRNKSYWEKCIYFCLCGSSAHQEISVYMCVLNVFYTSGCAARTVGPTDLGSDHTGDSLSARGKKNNAQPLIW